MKTDLHFDFSQKLFKTHNGHTTATCSITNDII